MDLDLSKFETGSQAYIDAIAKHLSEARKRKNSENKQTPKKSRKGKEPAVKKGKESANENVTIPSPIKSTRNDEVERKGGEPAVKDIQSSKDSPEGLNNLNHGASTSGEVAESDSDDDNSDSDEERHERNQGVKLFKGFDPSKLSYHKDGKSYVITYDKETKVFIMSGQYIGQVQTYSAMYSQSVLVKKGEIVENLRQAIEKLIKRKVSLFSKSHSECIGLFTDTIKNSNDENCLNLLNKGEAQLVPLSELPKLAGVFTAVLRCGRITKVNGEWKWKLSISEGKLDELPKEYDGYIRVLDKPSIKFF